MSSAEMVDLHVIDEVGRILINPASALPGDRR